MDDVSILATSTSISTNCQLLAKAYRKCQEWARKHSSNFNAKKSELIHFTCKATEGFALGDNWIAPQRLIRILGVYLNTSLSPKAHLQYLQSKIPGLLGSLRLLTQSTWGLGLETARRVYIGAIRPALSYGALTWFPIKNPSTSLRETLRGWQGRFLQIITGAYKATATEALEIETGVELLDLYLQKTALTGLERQASILGSTLEHLAQRLYQAQRSKRH